MSQDHSHETGGARFENPRGATDETSGMTNPGETPPAEGVGVGPTNPEMDVEEPGEGGRNRVWLYVIPALVLVFMVLAIIGRTAGMF